MKTEELYLKTIFCCMSCDGEIAEEEIEMVKNFCSNDDTFKEIEVEKVLNQWIKEINSEGVVFLKKHLNDLASVNLSKEEELKIVDYAIKIIEADNKIEYSEIKFFKKIRATLEVSDENILAMHPDKENYLLPDICEVDDFILDNFVYSEIKFN